jgi:hypothetical protein
MLWQAQVPLPVFGVQVLPTIVATVSPVPDAEGGSVEATAMTRVGYLRAVTRICAKAVLFTGSHPMGTTAGAIEVSKAIRATGHRRLRRVAAVPRPPVIASKAVKWIAIEYKLDNLYAATYLRIWMRIQWAYAHHQRTKLPLVLHRLLHLPDKLDARADRLELILNVPDCTGGG